MNQDTICALATANGMGAIGVIRVSGNEAFSIVQKCFKGKTLAEQPSHTIHYGYIYDNLKFEVENLKFLEANLTRGEAELSEEKSQI
ncbi:MAG: hypothetical protein Q4A00_04050, partial [Flavobacteriaceae bacterium]|nr:hypothetical protein [Flavobacteriaceae bacterium]